MNATKSKITEKQYKCFVFRGIRVILTLNPSILACRTAVLHLLFVGMHQDPDPRGVPRGGSSK